ncbi:MAG: hypothetical protein ACLFWL_17545 [Candidatus Brocadiia bacterium]
MKKLKLVAILACALVLSVVVGARAAETEGNELRPIGFDITADSMLSGTALDKAIQEGELKGEAGVYFEGTDPDDPDPAGAVGEGEDADYFFGTGYIEMAFESASVNGLQFGIGGIAVNQIWWDHEEWDVPTADWVNGDDYTDNYDDDAALNEAFIRYSFPNTKSSVLVGRKKFKKSAVMDGDFHQGFEIAVKDPQMVDVYFSAVEEWADDSGADEIGGESEMDELNDAGNWGYSLMAVISGDNFSVMPFVHRHEDVVLVYGLEAEGKVEMDENMSISFGGTWSEHNEDTPSSISSTDEDWNQYLLECKVRIGQASIGAGYYYLDDEVVNAPNGTGLFQDDFAPMEEIGGWADTSTYFLKLGYDFGALEIGMAYGIADDDRDDTGQTDSDAHEIDLEIEADITDRVAFEVLYADVNFDEDDQNNDYGYWEGGVSVSF